MLVPQEYDLKALEPIGHLLAVDPPLIYIAFFLLLEVGDLTASYMRDKR
ncbi:hypothetical protein [Virgibacillus sp. Bac332]|nr:hypothetical protein [Virgibacillus sp. Bac332]QRZ18604.1 hypothetical protein JUJ52_02285 [Virgibacillus sp. AGTR]